MYNITKIKQFSLIEFVSPLLKKKGTMYICPFHNENTASFSIKNNRWRCFGCNENGSIIDFVMLYYKLSFKDAVKFLCNHYNLSITDTNENVKEVFLKQRKILRKKNFINDVKNSIRNMEKKYPILILLYDSLPIEVLRKNKILWEGFIYYIIFTQNERRAIKEGFIDDVLDKVDIFDYNDIQQEYIFNNYIKDKI